MVKHKYANVNSICLHFVTVVKGKLLMLLFLIIRECDVILGCPC